MLFVLDNYDSFTYNLVQLFGELGAEPVVYRNDALTVEQVLALKPTAVVLSPGPRTPGEAGILVPLAPGDRRGVRRPRGASRSPHAREDVRSGPRRGRAIRGHTQSRNRHAVPLAGRGARLTPQGHRHYRVECGSTEGCGDHGDEAPPPPDLRRAVPPRVDRYLAREAVAGEFSAHRARRRLTSNRQQISRLGSGLDATARILYVPPCPSSASFRRGWAPAASLASRSCRWQANPSSSGLCAESLKRVGAIASWSQPTRARSLRSSSERGSRRC